MGFELEIQEPKRFKKPTIEEVRLFCEQNNIQINPEKFWWSCESRNWTVGKHGKIKMTSWKAAVRTWEQNMKDWEKMNVAKQQTRPQPKLHQAKPDRKLTQEQKQNRRSDIDQLKRLARGIKA